jgi:hypothetical protein
MKENKDVCYVMKDPEQSLEGETILLMSIVNRKRLVNTLLNEGVNLSAGRFTNCVIFLPPVSFLFLF